MGAYSRPSAPPAAGCHGFLCVCRYRWVKDGQLIEESLDTGLLRINKTLDLNWYQGKYRCYASNKYGTAESTLINIITEGQSLRVQVLIPQTFTHWGSG